MRNGDPNNSSIDYNSKESHTIQGTYIDICLYYWPDFTSAVNSLKYEFLNNVDEDW